MVKIQLRFVSCLVDHTGSVINLHFPKVYHQYFRKENTYKSMKIITIYEPTKPFLALYYTAIAL